MNGICRCAAVGCLLLFIASASCAQMYTVTDINPSGSTSEVSGINNAGQVVGNDYALGAFRTAANSPMNPATDLIGAGKWATGINDLGQVVGWTYGVGSFAFRTAPNSLVPIVIGGPGTLPTGINSKGQAAVVLLHPNYFESFRTAPNTPINPATDALGVLPSGNSTWAEDINDAGQVVGLSGSPSHAFRTSPNLPINPATDDLGTLGGSTSHGISINAFGQVVGASDIAGDTFIHAFRTAPNKRINPVTDDLGLGGANGINDYGEVVGTDWGYCPRACRATFLLDCLSSTAAA
jgi:probable HAF family extracellular repeat protein